MSPTPRLDRIMLALWPYFPHVLAISAALGFILGLKARGLL